MRLGHVVDKGTDGAEVRKFEGRTGTRYFAWAPGASIATPCITLREAREKLGITCAPKKIAA
jgi:hypothetical protein